MVLRSIAAIVVGFLFFTLLTSLIGIAVFSQITEKESLKPMLSGILLSQLKLGDQELTALYDSLALQCKGKTAVTQNLGSINITINCSDLSSLKPKDLPNYIASQAVDTLYERSFSCDVLECLLQGKVDVLISSVGNSFLKSLFSYSLVSTALFGALFGFLLNNVAKFLKGIGSTLFSTGVLLYLSTFLAPVLPAQSAAAAPLIEKAMSLMSNYSLITVVVGVIFFAAGFFLEKRKA